MNETSWIVGFVIAGVVVVIVVAVVLVIIKLATDIRRSAVTIIGDLERGREATDPLWNVRAFNQVAGETLDAARAARHALTGEGDR